MSARQAGREAFTKHIVAREELQRCGGALLGLALAPLFGLGSALRRARVLHPVGMVCGAEVTPVATGSARKLAERLAGPALLRFSAALWKRGAKPDVFGCAIRFTELPLSPNVRPYDQDLLLATPQRPWSAPAAFLTTRHRDFLHNHYFSLSPWTAAELGRVDFRISVHNAAAGSGTREERLALAAQSGRCSLLLEWAPYSGAWRRPQATSFAPLVRLSLTGLPELDQQVLRFNPFHGGRGVSPVGFINAMRRAPYPVSQTLRPS